MWFFKKKCIHVFKSHFGHYYECMIIIKKTKKKKTKRTKEKFQENKFLKTPKNIYQENQQKKKKQDRNINYKKSNDK